MDLSVLIFQPTQPRYHTRAPNLQTIRQGWALLPLLGDTVLNSGI